MRTKLTELSISKIVAQRGMRLELFDTLLPGLALRVTEHESKSWSVMYRVAGAGEGGKRGRLRRMTLGRFPLIDLKEARLRARGAMDAADRGLDPAHKRTEEAKVRSQRTFEFVCDRFVALHAKAHTETGAAAEYYLKTHAVSAWSGRPVEAIDRATAHELLDGLIQERGAPCAREVRKHLSKLFNWAVDRGMLAASPLAGMRRPELAYAPRERVLNMEELKAVWVAAGQMGYPFGPMFRLLLLTAQRRSEIAGARWPWISDDRTALEIPAACYKTNRPQVVPLSQPAQGIITSLPRWNGGDCMISSRGGATPVSGFSKAKLQLDQLCGVKGWTVHDLRRSGATHMARLGVAQEHIERVLGHAIEGVAGTYNRYSYLEEKRAALAKWGALWT